MRLSGRSSVLQLQRGGVWRTVCSEGWNNWLGVSACKQLGYSRYLMGSTGFLWHRSEQVFIKTWFSRCPSGTWNRSLSLWPPLSSTCRSTWCLLTSANHRSSSCRTPLPSGRIHFPSSVGQGTFRKSFYTWTLVHCWIVAMWSDQHFLFVTSTSSPPPLPACHSQVECSSGKVTALKCLGENCWLIALCCHDDWNEEGLLHVEHFLYDVQTCLPPVGSAVWKTIKAMCE